jgi:hypothetical protein
MPARKNLRPLALSAVWCASLVVASSGCRSPYYADQGAAFGGVTGAGVGAIVGEAVSDNPLAGAAIGAGVGALTGAVAGDALDEIEAKNRAQIAAQLGRDVRPGAATIQEVVAMTQSGVDPRLITSYVQNSGVAQPIKANGIIYMHQQGVASEVIEAMNNPPPQPTAPVRVGTRPAPVIIEEHYYSDPFWGPSPRFHYHHHRHRPRVGWGFSFSG